MLKKDTILIDSSTIDPQVSKEVGAKVVEKFGADVGIVCNEIR